METSGEGRLLIGTKDNKDSRNCVELRALIDELEDEVKKVENGLKELKVREKEQSGEEIVASVRGLLLSIYVLSGSCLYALSSVPQSR